MDKVTTRARSVRALHSSVDVNAAEFVARAAAMQDLCAKLDHELAAARDEGEEATILRHRERGKLTGLCHACRAK